MKDILSDKMSRDKMDSDMEANAMKAALQKLIDLPGGPLDDIPAPEQQPQQMAQAQPGQQPPPAEGQQPPAEQPMPPQGQQPPPAPAPQQGGMFGGFQTRQQQLDDELKKQMGQ